MRRRTRDSLSALDCWCGGSLSPGGCFLVGSCIYAVWWRRRAACSVPYLWLHPRVSLALKTCSALDTNRLSEQMITRSRNLEGAIQAGKESLERFPSSQLCSDDSDDAANIAADIAAASRRGVAVARPRPVAGCSTPP